MKFLESRWATLGAMVIAGVSLIVAVATLSASGDLRDDLEALRGDLDALQANITTASDQAAGALLAASTGLAVLADQPLTLTVNIAEEIDETLGISGFVMTKVDGDARGGAALSIRAVTGLPIKFIGVGEKVDALEPFIPDRFASRILHDAVGQCAIRYIVERNASVMKFAKRATANHDAAQRIGHGAARVIVRCYGEQTAM